MKQTILFLSIVIFLSCTKEIELKQKPAEPKLVLNSIIMAGKEINAHISHTKDLFDSTDCWVNDALVYLFANGTFMGNLAAQIDSTGWYKSEFIAQEGTEYRFEVIKSGYESVSGKAIVPTVVSISSASIDLNSFIYYNDNSSDTTYGWSYNLSFDDRDAMDDYFEIQSISLGRNYFGKKVIGLLNHPFAFDPVFSSEDYIAFNPNQFVFSDNSFNGGNTTIEMKMQNTYGGGGDTLAYNMAYEDINEQGYYLVLRHISKSYYEFVKSWVKHYTNRQFGNSFDDLIFKGLAGNPVPLYSNVENGYGIVAAFSQSYRHVPVNE